MKPQNKASLARPIPRVTFRAVKKGVFEAAAKAEIAGVSRSILLLFIYYQIIGIGFLWEFSNCEVKRALTSLTSSEFRFLFSEEIHTF